MPLTLPGVANRTGAAAGSRVGAPDSATGFGTRHGPTGFVHAREPPKNCKTFPSRLAAAAGGWQPFAFPPFAALLPNRSCDTEHYSRLPMLAVVHKVHPVLPNNGTTDSHFYHLALGCSDTFVRAGPTLVARNRYHALALLAQRRFRLNGSQVVPWVQSAMQVPSACGFGSMELMQLLVSYDICASPDDPVLMCLQRSTHQRLRVGHATVQILSLMTELGIDTTVLAYEPPYNASREKMWKTEVMRRTKFEKDRFYNIRGQRCRMRVSPRPSRCIYCADESISQTACLG